MQSYLVGHKCSGLPIAARVFFARQGTFLHGQFNGKMTWGKLSCFPGIHLHFYDINFFCFKTQRSSGTVPSEWGRNTFEKIFPMSSLSYYSSLVYFEVTAEFEGSDNK